MVMILAPDEHQAKLYHDRVEPNIKKGTALACAHNFNIHFEQIVPCADFSGLHPATLLDHCSAASRLPHYLYQALVSFTGLTGHIPAGGMRPDQDLPWLSRCREPCCTR